ncbi:DUF262 domain-containing protein [Rhodococcus hoagii]|nr:DUF262 domain-containing protein [Prescottella equi]
MSSFVTSYVGLFTSSNDGVAAIDRVEIPLIQRDYAQGRENADVNEIRSDFLDVLCTAVSGSGQVGLDFIYGEVRNETLLPLDGQQRLTTLFLLHWYVAFRTGQLSADLPWTQFRYATRASAALFCARIVTNPPPIDVENPSAWIADQTWYLHLWRHDPTIQSMRVMIKALDRRLRKVDLTAAWARLISDSDPAITFHVLPIDEIGAGDELYIKMNSRGKPLTPFENFKARFEKALEGSPRAADFAHRVDGIWSDVIWRYRGSDDIVDDQFVRYFSFVTEVTEWRNGITTRGRLDARAEVIFGHDAPNGSDNLDFLFDAFDACVDTDVEDVFARLITVAATKGSKGNDKVRFLGARQVDYFRSCCDTYTFGSGGTFGSAETLTLYAVLLHRINRSEDFARRLRVLRNLLEGSTSELRAGNMPALIREVERLVLADTLTEAVANLSAFNEAQIDDERAKAEFLEAHPDLTDVVFGLEEHRLLRGSLVAFELDAERLADRASCFEVLMSDRKIWPVLTAALLAKGDYSRERKAARSFRFGSPEEDRWWRELLTGTKRSNLRTTSTVLASLLDAVSASNESPADALEMIRESWLSQQESYDWRYYLVKYDAMREGKSGIYFTEGGRMGFSLCMLDKTQLNSWYHDPFLDAVWRATEVRAAVSNYLFTGYETDPRWMEMRKSGTRIRCTTSGFSLRPPPDPSHRDLFDSACIQLGIGENHYLTISQTTRNGIPVDTEDRVKRGARLIEALAAAGL